ncbi:MAG TPA: hypothetical protein VNC41_16375 [Acidimicrobiia bacterium]|nr:hypothetical protein [Acidimicrobiia bacterium]
MSVSLPVIVGAGVVIVALVCIGLTARRRRRTDAAAAPAEPVEAVFVDDMPGELQSFMAPAASHSQAAAAHAHVYPVHKLQEVAEAPITFGPPRRDPVEEPVAEPEAPKLEVVPDPEPEVESQIEPALAIAGVADTASPAEQEPTVEAAPVTESVPSPEVALLTAQIEVLADTIARLTDRLDAVASAVTIAPAPASVPTPAEAFEPAPERAPDPQIELAPEPVMLRSVAYEPDAQFALESELEPDVEPPAFARKRVDDDLLSWPSDDDPDRFSGRQARRDI